MNERGEQTTDMLNKLTVLGTIVLPMNIITGMWGMNVLVPGQDVDSLGWFFASESITSTLRQSTLGDRRTSLHTSEPEVIGMLTAPVYSHGISPSVRSDLLFRGQEGLRDCMKFLLTLPAYGVQ